MEIGFETDKPSHLGHEAVLKWAADSNDHGGYKHICEPELWLPVDFDSVFEAENPVGHRCKIGSTHKLFREMQHLNAATWNAAETQIHEWNFLEADSLENDAKWGFAIWHALARFAHQTRLPMILDY
jgi:hypothetical protein